MFSGLSVLIWLEAFAFRALPFVVLGMCSKRVPLRGKVGTAAGTAAFATFVALRHPSALQLFVNVALVWGYLLVASAAIYCLRRCAPMLRLSGPCLFVVCAALFLLLPALLIQIPFSVLLVAYGFEIMLSAYSYYTESLRSRETPTLGECLDFLLVNPTVVFTARGTEIGPPAVRPIALWRAALGLTINVYADLLATVVGFADVPGFAMRNLGASGMPVAFATTQTVQLFVLYFAHSGLASFKIGCMALLGYRVPERYNYPFLATNPFELWRRWNTYIGHWIHRYVFFPLALSARRALPAALADVGKGLALLTSFVACGAMHELSGYALRFAWPLGALLAFTLCGLAMLLWIVAGRIRIALQERLGFEKSALLRGAAAVVSFAAWCPVFFVFGWLALPGLSGLGLPPLLRDALLPNPMIGP